MREEYKLMKNALLEIMSDDFNLQINPDLMDQLIEYVKGFVEKISNHEKLEDDGERFLRQIDTFFYQITGDDKILDKYNQETKNKRFGKFKNFIKLSTEAFDEIHKLNPENSKVLFTALTVTKIVHHLVSTYSEELRITAN